MIEHDFTYNVPDMFGTTTMDKNFTETKTYRGPEFFYVTLDEDNKINVTDCLNEMNEDLDFRERVVNMSLKFNHLIVCTTS